MFLKQSAINSVYYWLNCPAFNVAVYIKACFNVNLVSYVFIYIMILSPVAGVQNKQFVKVFYLCTRQFMKVLFVSAISLPECLKLKHFKSSEV